MRFYLVEDDQRLARSYQRHLQDDGHEVEVAYDGEVALYHLRKHADEYTVIILDVMLPRRDGVSVCRALRQAGVTTPILLLTALDQTEDKVAGLDAGADDYLTKPFPIDELLARLRALARRSPHFIPDATATNVQVGPLTLDLLRHEAYFHNALVPLTAREFALLEYLARNAGRVLTRSQLMLHVWPDGTEAGSNVLDTYIRYLREKLEYDAIITVRGIGYRLRAPQEWATA